VQNGRQQQTPGFVHSNFKPKILKVHLWLYLERISLDDQYYEKVLFLRFIRLLNSAITANMAKAKTVSIRLIQVQRESIVV
jgi:hypothetical protein